MLIFSKLAKLSKLVKEVFPDGPKTSGVVSAPVQRSSRLPTLMRAKPFDPDFVPVIDPTPRARRTGEFVVRCWQDVLRTPPPTAASSSKAHRKEHADADDTSSTVELLYILFQKVLCKKHKPRLASPLSRKKPPWKSERSHHKRKNCISGKKVSVNLLMCFRLTFRDRLLSFELEHSQPAQTWIVRRPCNDKANTTDTSAPRTMVIPATVHRAAGNNPFVSADWMEKYRVKPKKRTAHVLRGAIKRNGMPNSPTQSTQNATTTVVAPSGRARSRTPCGRPGSEEVDIVKSCTRAAFMCGIRFWLLQEIRWIESSLTAHQLR